MTQPIHEQYQNQLMQIELAVMRAFDENPDLTDAQIDSAYEELSKRYRAEATAHEYKPGKLNGPRQVVHDLLLPITELLVGRPANMAGAEVISAEEMRLCLNRLRKSINTWSKQGRQGYVRYISNWDGLAALDDTQ